MRLGLMSAWLCAASSFAMLAMATSPPRRHVLHGKGPASRLPTLGWNSWNAHHCDINAAKFLEAAEAIVDRGLRDAGYTYINIDDCWQAEGGRVHGHISVDRHKFPEGIDGLAKRIHDMNFKIGIYSSAGTHTCAGYTGSLGYELIDAADWSSWGIDYLKYDNCHIPGAWRDQYVACEPRDVRRGVNGTCDRALEPRLAPPGYDWRTSKSYERFRRMSDALGQQPREVVLSACIWGLADVFAWGRDVAASWRMSADIEPGWASVKAIVNENAFRSHATGFYGRNDADMLEVGNGLSRAETRTHFALWAAMKSPLLIGADVRNLTAEDVRVLGNRHLLAFNQDDEFGEPARPYRWGANPDWTNDAASPAEFWSGPSKAGRLVLMMNVGEETARKTAAWSEVPGLHSGRYRVTDVWTGEDLGCLDGYSADVDAHDTAVILVGRRC